MHVLAVEGRQRSGRAVGSQVVKRGAPSAERQVPALRMATRGHDYLEGREGEALALFLHDVPEGAALGGRVIFGDSRSLGVGARARA